MAEAKPQQRPRQPEICDGCIEAFDLPPRVVVENGQRVRKHFFLCGFFTVNGEGHFSVKDTHCAGRSIVPRTA